MFTRLYFYIFVVLLLLSFSSFFGLAYVDDGNITPLFGQALARELLEAHGRGVEVEVILDKAGEEDRKNERCYIFLKEAGVKVRYDGLELITHSKVLVVDEEMAIVGSQNWNRASLSLNNEAAVLIRSRKISQGLLKGEPVSDDNIMTLDENNYYIYSFYGLSPARVPSWIYRVNMKGWLRPSDMIVLKLKVVRNITAIIINNTSLVYCVSSNRLG